jgi:hypothetical protein
MLQRCEKDSFADLLYSEQPKDLLQNRCKRQKYLKATWTAGLSEKI